MSEQSVDSFIARWGDQTGGQERANYVLFLTELCDVIGVARPDPAGSDRELNAYVFERLVHEPDGEGGHRRRRIDLYKHGCFVLEAKQSRLDPAAAAETEEFNADAAPRGRRGAGKSWDTLMFDAKAQAVNYARCLPAGDGWPPFVLVCDVGHVIEVFADFTGQGKNYAQFPDRQGFRIYLHDLRDPAIRARLKAIWDDPQSLDPARRSAQVTRAIARRLAAVSKALESSRTHADDVAMFLMRCLFTMFAEDVELLPKKSFRDLLSKCEDEPDKFQPLVAQLWEAMDQGSYAFALEAQVKRFNGEFFKYRHVCKLGRKEIGALLAAAEADWREVEPAIFGTLLEQALDPAERRRLGAHYTPRAYVERLVVATVLEPLRAEWHQALATAERQKEEGRNDEAAAGIAAFHARLCQVRVLDPACGTGNFLYVALELMKRLEGEVLEALASLGGQESFAALEGHTVDPRQFLGIEVNPRAAAIAELVLWIGYLQWHFRTRGAPPSEPILRAFHNIRKGDAVLDWDGAPVPAVVAGAMRYPNPRRPVWPSAEFIIGNPPFIGGKDLRERLGDGYAEALWQANGRKTDSADFVMYWWKHAAEAGDVLSRLLVARFYEGQFGFPELKDLKASIENYTKAADDGNAGAMAALGSRLLSGDEKIRDEKKGREWLKKAIAAKEYSAYLALGDYEENVKKDPKAALAEYERGKDAGQVDCMLRDADCYLEGKGVEKDTERGLSLLRKAAEAGNPVANYRVAVQYLGGEKPDKANILPGYGYLVAAANGNLGEAQNELGLLYLSGKLGTADVPAGVAWLTNAAKGGNAQAQNNLATLYERGVGGIPKNLDNALQLYTLAGNQGNGPATLALARLINEGIGTKSDPVKAWALATLAVDPGPAATAALVVDALPPTASTGPGSFWDRVVRGWHHLTGSGS